MNVEKVLERRSNGLISGEEMFGILFEHLTKCPEERESVLAKIRNSPHADVAERLVEILRTR